MIRSWYLPLSETFIYSELVNLNSVKPIVCTKKTMNLQHFPFQRIFLFKNLQELQNILQKQKVNLIHARFGTTGAEILDVKKRLGLPMLTSFHGFDLPTNRKSMVRYNGRLGRLFKEGDAFTVTSNHMKEILVRYGCPEHKIFVHYSGIDVERFAFQERKKPKDGDIVILSVGRLIEKKGMHVLIDAFHHVQKKIPNVSLRIAGDGPLRDQLQAKVRQLNLGKKVTILGSMSHAEVAKEMRRAHLFALASTTDRNGNQEGIPNVIKEAMATGLPVVSTWHAGIPELVHDGKTGYLVPERNPKALAQQLLKLIRESKEWGKMGKRGRQVVEQSFHAKKQILELEQIYATMLGEKGEGEKSDAPSQRRYTHT